MTAFLIVARVPASAAKVQEKGQVEQREGQAVSLKAFGVVWWLPGDGCG